MKHLILIALVVGMFACGGGETAYAWTKADTQRQLVYTTLHVIDWGQTRHIRIKCPNAQNKCWEINPILGKHPSIQQVDNYFAATLAIHTFVSYLLPPKGREIWQMLWIGAELKSTVFNYRAGIIVHF